jgi:hypothetical protein
MADLGAICRNPRNTQLATTKIYLDTLDANLAEHLIGLSDAAPRSGNIIHITAAPEDLDPWQAPARTTLTITAGKASLQTVLQPAAWAGAMPVRWQDLANRPSPYLPNEQNDWAPNTPYQYDLISPELHIGDLAIVRCPTNHRPPVES